MINKKPETELFEETLEDNLYFTERGCEEMGRIRVPKTTFNFIKNISGECTDANSGPDYYNNPRAMFVALDLIYKSLDTIQEES